MIHKCIYQICEYAFVTKQFQKYALWSHIYSVLASLAQSGGAVWKTIKKTRKHTIKQPKGTTNNQKQTQTFNQANNQSSTPSIIQTVSKERKQTNPKKKPYIKN